MPLTNISAYRIAGYQFTDNDFDTNAEIEISKLGTRTLYRTIPACAMGTTDATRANLGVFGGLTMSDSGGATSIHYSFKIPDEWESGTDITITILWATSATAGDLRLALTYAAIKKGEDMTVTSATVATTDTAKGTANLINEMNFTIVSTNLEKGDYIGLRFVRDPANAADTITADAIILAMTISITGRG